MSKLSAPEKFLRIGQLAARSGVSAKALRLYEARGLLRPDFHSESGYRLYGAPALARLNEIGVLKGAGFTLAEIGKLLERKGSAGALVGLRILALRREVHAKSQALTALERAWCGLDSASSDIDQLLEYIMTNEKLDMHFGKAEMAEFKRRAETLGKHFTPGERERMRRHAEELGESRVQQANVAWPKLIAEVRTAMDTGIPPGDPTVQDMGRRWHALIQAFTGGDVAIGRRMKEAYDREPQVMAAQGMDHAMFAYIREAMQAAGLALPA
jgi:DNA-binding transcriptional MerR regulator